MQLLCLSSIAKAIRQAGQVNDNYKWKKIKPSKTQNELNAQTTIDSQFQKGSIGTSGNNAQVKLLA